MEGRVAREKGRKWIDTDRNVAIVASFRSPGYRSPGLQREVCSMGWESDSFRGESLSYIRLSVMAIRNFLPMEYFPILFDRYPFVVSFIDRNLIPISSSFGVDG